MRYGLKDEVDAEEIPWSTPIKRPKPEQPKKRGICCCKSKAEKEWERY